VIDYYRVLQVDPQAEPEVIEAAYRRLARKYHPDVNRSPDANSRMQQLNEAYEVLKDPVRRAAFDRSRLNGKTNASPRAHEEPAEGPFGSRGDSPDATGQSAQWQRERRQQAEEAARQAEVKRQQAEAQRQRQEAAARFSEAKRRQAEAKQQQAEAERRQQEEYERQQRLNQEARNRRAAEAIAQKAEEEYRAIVADVARNTGRRRRFLILLGGAALLAALLAVLFGALFIISRLYSPNALPAVVVSHPAAMWPRLL